MDCKGLCREQRRPSPQVTNRDIAQRTVPTHPAAQSSPTSTCSGLGSVIDEAGTFERQRHHDSDTTDIPQASADERLQSRTNKVNNLDILGRSEYFGNIFSESCSAS